MLQDPKHSELVMGETGATRMCWRTMKTSAATRPPRNMYELEPFC